MNPIESFQRMHARAVEHDAKVILSVVKSDNTNMVVYQAELTTEGDGFTTQTPMVTGKLGKFSETINQPMTRFPP